MVLLGEPGIIRSSKEGCTGPEYKIIKKIGEGTFAVVVKAKYVKDGKHYACKTLKQVFLSSEHAFNLREVQTMRKLNPHPNILQLHSIIFEHSTGSLSLICELMEMNVYEMIRTLKFPMQESLIHNYMYQLCKSLDHMHSHGIIHRDIKPENILIKQGTLKLGDFGSSKSMYTRPPYTEYISTRWYRAPECLLTDGHYSVKMDVWSAGCVFYEIVSLKPLFPGSNELDQVSKIHNVLGTPKPSILRKFKQSRKMPFNFPSKRGRGLASLIQCSDASLALLRDMLEYDPDSRISARDTLQHPCFRELMLAERRAATGRRGNKTLERLERGESAANALSNAGDHQQGRRQAQISPCHAVELPRLSVALPKVTRAGPYPTPSYNTIRLHRERLPVIISRKCSPRQRRTRDDSQYRPPDTFTMPDLWPNLRPAEDANETAINSDSFISHNK
ncbi:MAPK/MAK/MRK overlapping kinase [Aplochiton taeniatus]